MLYKKENSYSDKLWYEIFSVTERKVKSFHLIVSPYILVNNKLHKVTELEIIPNEEAVKAKSIKTSSSKYAVNSVLSSGRFVKVQVTESGVYKITYDDLVSMGFRNPKHVRVYGYGGQMLFEDFSKPYHDDLPEVSIYVSSGNNRQFGSSDYILFYGYGVDRWEYNSNLDLFTHKRNTYSNAGYYFITASENEGNVLTQTSEITTDIAGDITLFDE